MSNDIAATATIRITRITSSETTIGRRIGGRTSSELMQAHEVKPDTMESAKAPIIVISRMLIPMLSKPSKPMKSYIELWKKLIVPTFIIAAMK